MKKNYCFVWESKIPGLIKFLMIMKLTFFIVLISALSVLAGKSYSQTKTLNLKLEKATVKEVLSKIEDQSEFYFMYSEKVIDVNREVSVNIENQNIETVLNSLFAGTDVNYTVKDRIIVLATPDVFNSNSQANLQQQKSISGKVTDSAGQPLPGVTVVVKGTTTGTITDPDGNYAINNIPDDAVLQFSFVGMKTQEVKVGTQTSINVVMSDEAVGIEEVVTIGYGTSKKATATGSIVSTKGDELKSVPTTNFANMLTGRLPGLVSVSPSGEPGNDTPILRVRGANTLGDNNALVIIDGVSGRDMTGLDPTDIESISVLKDASAAIFGARAANGVILITTKRGKIGKPEVNLNFNYGVSKPTVIPKMADAATYATMLNEIDYYSGKTPGYKPEEIQKFADGSEPWLYPNTDWFAETFEPSTPQSEGDISIRGGSESMNYFVSTGFRSQDAIYKNSDAKYSQVNFRSNLDGQISKDIRLSFDLAGRQENRNMAANPFEYLINRSKPMFIAYYPGNKPAAGYQAGQSPVVLASDLLGYDMRKTYFFESNVKLFVTIPWVKGLSITGNVAYDKRIYNTKYWRTPYTLYSWDRLSYDENNEPKVVGAIDGPYKTPELTQSMEDGYTATFNALINYERSINNRHNFKVLAGAEKITGYSMYLTAFRRNFVSTKIDQMFAGGDPDKNNGGSANQNARFNYFGRVNYDFLQKYLLEFVWRYDGSYIFPEQGRFGFFPGISAGWRISEEDFWKNNLSFINYFKLRGSWGQTGNDRIAEYQYLSSYSFGAKPYILNQNLEVKTLNELRIANPDITWEIANQSNIGFDSEMFGGKLQFTAEYFYNLRTNILAYRNASVPASAGLTLPRENIGEVVNQGFEIQLGFKDKISEFTYEVSGNLAHAENKILFWDETPGVPDYQQSTGQPMNAALYYKAIGIFKDKAAVDNYPHWQGARPGDIIFEDVNGDKKIDGLDMIRYSKTELPTLTGGISINLGYKRFYTSMLFQGAFGAVRTYNLESGYQGDFLADDADGRWTENNTDAKKPRTWNKGEYWTLPSSGTGTTGINNTYWLKSNDYVRMKDFQIGYNLPKELTNKMHISNLSIYFVGMNLITFTHFKSFDPETVGNVYPLSKVFNFGIKLTL
jgi:TonB-linked SusC/RagA family outer membrane protein